MWIVDNSNLLLGYLHLEKNQDKTSNEPIAIPTTHKWACVPTVTISLDTNKSLKPDAFSISDWLIPYSTSPVIYSNILFSRIQQLYGRTHVLTPHFISIFSAFFSFNFFCQKYFFSLHPFQYFPYLTSGLPKLAKDEVFIGNTFFFFVGKT